MLFRSLLSASRSNPARSRARVTGSLTHSLSKLHGLDLGPLFCFDSGEAGKGNECFFFFFFSKFFLFSFNSELKKKKNHAKRRRFSDFNDSIN